MFYQWYKIIFRVAFSKQTGYYYLMDYSNFNSLKAISEIIIILLIINKLTNIILIDFSIYFDKYFFRILEILFNQSIECVCLNQFFQCKFVRVRGCECVRGMGLCMWVCALCSTVLCISWYFRNYFLISLMQLTTHTHKQTHRHTHN